jgi:hypothetical protein
MRPSFIVPCLLTALLSLPLKAGAEGLPLSPQELSSPGLLQSVRIMPCVPDGRNLLLGKFAFPDTTMNCFVTSQTTFRILLSDLYQSGFGISEIIVSQGKVLYYLQRTEAVP